MSDPTGSMGVYGEGPYWVRWSSYERNDVQTQYSTDPAELLTIYDRWKANPTNGSVTASKSVMDLIRARNVPAAD